MKKYTAAKTKGHYRKIAKQLADAHRHNDPYILKILLAVDPTECEIRLVEITTEVPCTMDAIPFHFATTEKIPFPSAVILMTPKEWDYFTNGKLKLPEDWKNFEEI